MEVGAEGVMRLYNIMDTVLAHDEKNSSYRSYR